MKTGDPRPSLTRSFLALLALAVFPSAGGSGWPAGPESAPSIVLLSPNGGEALAYNSTFDVSWEVSGGVPGYSIQLRYSTNGSNGPFVLITNNIQQPAAGRGEYRWMVPKTPTASGYLRAWVNDQQQAPSNDTSDGPFTIAGELDSVSISPSNATVAAGRTQQFTVRAQDAAGSRIPAAALQWSVNSSGPGTIDQQGLFTAVDPGRVTVEVQASYLGIARSASARVEVVLANHTLSGVVVDEQDAPVAGARVEVLEDPGGQVAASSVTGQDGRFSFALTGGRRYQVRVTYPGGEQVLGEAFELNSDVSVRVSRRPATPMWSSWWFLLAAGGAAGFGLLSLLWLLGGEAARLALLTLPVVFYSRLSRDRLLDNFARGRIYERIRTEPGISFNMLRRRLGLAHGTLAYHVHTLEREGFVRSARDGSYRRFYSRELPSYKWGVMLTAFQEKILGAVLERPGVSQSDIAARLGTKRQNVNYNVSRLVRKGMLRLEGWGWSRGCYPTKNAATVAAGPARS